MKNIGIITRHQLAHMRWVNESGEAAWLALKAAEATKDAMEAAHRAQMLLATSTGRRNQTVEANQKGAEITC
ncbi:MAG TPA: hypothetical protein PLJ74_12645 [Myxococcota bacterium]|nr:hypothetical protein [Myxococcota bacterium]